MADNNMDYCQLLGLNPFNESKYTTEAILKKIDDKETKWQNGSRNKQNGTDERYKLVQILNCVPDMRRVMSDQGARASAFAISRTALKGKCMKIRSDCIILTDGTYILLPGVIDNYVKKLKWDGITKADVLKAAGVKEDKPPQPISEKSKRAFTSISEVQAYTPAEMLNKVINNENLEIRIPALTDASSLNQIREAFEVCDKRINNVKADVFPEQDSFIQVFRGLKLILDDDKALQELIVYGKYIKMLQGVFDTVEQEYTNKQFNRQYFDELLNVRVPRDANRDMVIKILQEFCYRKKISANFSPSSSSMTRCPECGSMITSDRNTAFCPICGKNFKMVCPSCNTQQQSGNAVCIKCGFNFKDGETKAQNGALNFRMDLQKGTLYKAESDLMKVRQAYANYPGIQQMEMLLRQAFSNMTSMKKALADAYSMKRYATAKKIGDELNLTYPDAFSNDVDVKQKYEDAYKRFISADKFCTDAKNPDIDKATRIDLFVTAIMECPDHPDARSELIRHRPQGPVDPSAKTVDGKLVMRFQPPLNSTGLTYCIYREKGSLPVVTDDTRPLAEIPSCEFTDKDLQPGVDYYYSVHSKRWGIISKEAAHVGPVIVLAEVDKINIEPIEGGLRIMFEKPRGATRVRVWRADASGSGEETELPIKDQNVYDDMVKGGNTYHYLFLAEYETRNRVERTRGIKMTAVAPKLPEPIREIRIQRDQRDGTFTASWASREKVTLFYSDKDQAMPGNTVRMSDLRSWMKAIKPVQTYMDGIRFVIPDGAVIYLYPVIEMGPIGIVGSRNIVSNLKPFRDVERRVCNNDCVITMDWPDKAVSAKMAISDYGPRGLDDRNVEIKTVSREEYDLSKQVRIPMGRSKVKFINIFAVYLVEKTYLPSRGIVIDAYNGNFKKVHYTLKPDRKGFSIQFVTDEDAVSLPPMMAVRTATGIPLHPTDGEVIWRSDGELQLQSGAKFMTVDVKGRVDLENVRLFFQNEESYAGFRFVHPLFNRRS